MPKTILMVHGRHFKPPKKDLKKLWIEALRHGIERDHSEKVQAFKSAKVELVYYGDISNAYLSETLDEPVPDDLDDRNAALERLKQYKRSQFTKTNYRKLPGYNPWMEGLADLLAGPLSFLHLSDAIIERVAPDLGEYWGSYRFGSDVRAVFTDAIIKAMKKSGDICVIGHSLGSMISYDVFWKLSHYGEYRTQSWNRKVRLWITIGSPLADETVKRNLKGAGFSGTDRYPTNVVDWLNVAAEDDYIAHDQKVANDFKAMKKLGNVKSIKDKRIYNLAVRSGKSNPHHGVGYLIHPVIADALAAWL